MNKKNDITHDELVAGNISALGADAELRRKSLDWMVHSSRHGYSYNFSWMGRPIIQFPQDIAALQEIIWDMKPDVVIETGIAHGGSLVFSASMLTLLGGDGFVVGIDIDIRKHNREALEAHPMMPRIRLIEGSSIDAGVVAKVEALVEGCRNPLVILDSNHTHDHVLRELMLYSKFVKKGGRLIVFDTVVEDFPDGYFDERPWGKGDNPKTAVHEFLKHNDRFVIDKSMQDKLQITVAPDGYLKCVKD